MDYMAIPSVSSTFMRLFEEQEPDLNMEPCIVRTPPCILDLITSLLYPKEISLLWTTGSRALQRLMANGGVTNYELVFAVSGDRKWPSRVSSFRLLKSLIIRAPFGSGFHKIDVKALPPSITRIHFEFNEAESCFYLHPSKSSHLLPEPQMLDISTLFPNLRSIVLAGAYHVSNQFVSSFPKSIHTMSVQTIDDVQLPGTPRFFSVDGLDKLPPELETLSVQGYCPWGRSDFLKLPSTLISLNLLGTCPIEDDCFSALPPLLENFELTGCNRMLVASDSLSRLPTSLTNLKLRHVANMSAYCFEYLPRNLVSLELGGPSLEIGTPDLKRLPPRLTSLHITDCSIASETVYSSLPNALTSFLLRITRPYPAGLNTVPASSKGLPRSLTHLDIVDAQRRSGGFSNSFFFGLPRGILVLRLIPHERVTHEIVQALPRGLLDIDLGSAKIPCAYIRRLPRTITKLNIRHWADLDAEAIAELPPLLDSLILLRSPAIIDRAIGMLPSGLTHLELRHCPLLTDACGPLLPKGLKTLCLDGPHEITGAITAYLPPGLTSLQIASTQPINANYDYDHKPSPPAAPVSGLWAYVRGLLRLCVSHCCASMASTLSQSPCSHTQLVRSLPQAVPFHKECKGIPSGRQRKAETWNCPHTSFSQNECLTCRSLLFESFCSRLRIHATLRLVWGLKLEHARYDRRQLDALTFDEIHDLDAEFELEIRSMRSYILYFSPSTAYSPIQERAKKLSRLTEIDPSPPPSPSPIALGIKVGNGIRQVTSADAACNKSKSRVAQWYIRQMCSTILESLMESLYIYVWRHELDWDSFDASIADLTLLKGLHKTEEQEIRWRKVLALLVLFERTRSQSLAREAEASSELANELIIDNESVIRRWTMQRTFLAKLSPPNPIDLKSAIIRYEESVVTFPSHWPDLSDVENSLCRLADCESRCFLDNISEVLYLSERVFSELDRLVACGGVLS